MSVTNEGVDWRQLREFTGVELTKSHVLSWHVEGDTLMIDVDVLLTPEHAFYEKPRPAERNCVRPAMIEFPHCEAVSVNGVAMDEPLSDTSARLELGAIKGLTRMDDGPFEITGEFGTVLVDAERPILRLQRK
ncbi:MAG: hypothetical protein OER97_02370 [Gammaproteobacteria bacterium]|nr:hypothetical protein [Gammaproteobacteria bacterium]